MRVAQITCDLYSNYGTTLQKYALQQTIRKFVEDTEVIWHSESTVSLKNKFRLQLMKINSFKNFIQSKNCNFHISKGFLKALRIEKIKKFDDKNISVRFVLSNLEEIANDYDFFVVGSDQVWNPFGCGRESKYFLDFAPRQKRIAYSASIACPEIPNELKELFRKGISSFDYISVREEQSVKIIKELTGQDALLVLDPTLLLTPQEWLKISQKPNWLNEKYERGYVLTYYLRNNPPPAVVDVAKYLNLPLINLLDFNNYWHYVTSPSEFIYLFANASLIFTNSFHGLCFSILFKRPFINIEIDKDRTISTRIPGILKMFGLENRIVPSDKIQISNNFFDIDYSTRDKILPMERDKSFKFLSNALGLFNN